MCVEIMMHLQHLDNKIRAVREIEAVEQEMSTLYIHHHHFGVILGSLLYSPDKSGTPPCSLCDVATSNNVSFLFISDKCLIWAHNSA